MVQLFRGRWRIAALVPVSLPAWPISRTDGLTCSSISQHSCVATHRARWGIIRHELFAVVTGACAHNALKERFTCSLIGRRARRARSVAASLHGCREGRVIPARCWRVCLMRMRRLLERGAHRRAFAQLVTGGRSSTTLLVRPVTALPGQLALDPRSRKVLHQR